MKNIIWFRRDLRLYDHAALHKALQVGDVMPVFIFDEDILGKLSNKQDKRVAFLYQIVTDLKNKLEEHGCTLHVFHGKPVAIFKQLIANHSINQVFVNRDYEPYAMRRDNEICSLLKSHNIQFTQTKDHVIFDTDEITKADGKPYAVFTPYMKRWKHAYTQNPPGTFESELMLDQLETCEPSTLLPLEDLGFSKIAHGVNIEIADEKIIRHYHEDRDFPAMNGTSRLGPHIRFGTISIRQLAATAHALNDTWLNQIIWRDFFIQTLFHFPFIADKAFRPAYDNIPWENDMGLFQSWCEGKTGFPIVDAGMRELNQTGYMHNRVRMITANFLTKLLLTDWRWGEKYFADRLLDYEMASNIGNWQWACGSGCDAAPYFRIFNPETQIKRFDPDFRYINEWVPEFGTTTYPAPVVDYKIARQRALSVIKQSLAEYSQAIAKT